MAPMISYYEGGSGARDPFTNAILEPMQNPNVHKNLYRAHSRPQFGTSIWRQFYDEEE